MNNYDNKNIKNKTQDMKSQMKRIDFTYRNGNRTISAYVLPVVSNEIIIDFTYLGNSWCSLWECDELYAYDAKKQVAYLIDFPEMVQILCEKLNEHRGAALSKFKMKVSLVHLFNNYRHVLIGLINFKKYPLENL